MVSGSVMQPRRCDRSSTSTQGARSGIAIVATLVTLVLVVGLGLSSMFLAQMNIRTTENVRSQAIAQNAAETGVDVVRLALQEAYRTNGAWPSSFAAPALTGVLYEIVAGSYQIADDRVELEVRGFGPNDAVHTMQVNFAITIDTVDGGPPEEPESVRGIVAEGNVDFPGSEGIAPTLRDVRIHGNKGVGLGGGVYQTCAVERNEEDGSCPGNNWTTVTYANSSDSSFPVSTTTGSNCVAPGGGTGGKGKGAGGTQLPCRIAPEQTVTVGYDARLQAAAGDALSADGTVNMGSAACSDAQPDTLCLPGSGTYSADSIPAGVTRIIANGDIQITGTGPLQDLLLVSTGGGVTFPDSYSVLNVRVFSNNSIALGNGFVADGRVTIASRGATPFADVEAEDIGECDRGVRFQGQSPAIQDGSVTMLVLSEQCIKIAGAPFSDVTGLFKAGTNIKIAGTPFASYTGGLEAVGDIKFAGTPGTFFDSFLPLDNPDGTGGTPPEVAEPVVNVVVMR